MGRKWEEHEKEMGEEQDRKGFKRNMGGRYKKHVKILKNFRGTLEEAGREMEGKSHKQK